MAESIEEIQAMLIKDVQDIVKAYQAAAIQALTPEQVKAVEDLKKAGYSVEQAKVNEAAVEASKLAFGNFKQHSAMLELKGAGTRESKPVSERNFFANELAVNTETAAFRDMTERLEGVDGKYYDLISYNPDAMKKPKGASEEVKMGEMEVTVLSLGLVKDGKLNGDQGKKITIKGCYPGSIADLVKRHRHINGVEEKAWELSHKVITGS
jgi:hypothetical protein